MVRRDLERMSRADSDPFTPRPASRLATLWTLWRASRSQEFRGGLSRWCASGRSLLA
jgi:phytoene synthase